MKYWIKISFFLIILIILGCNVSEVESETREITIDIPVLPGESNQDFDILIGFKTGSRLISYINLENTDSNSSINESIRISKDVNRVFISLFDNNSDRLLYKQELDISKEKSEYKVYRFREGDSEKNLIPYKRVSIESGFSHDYIDNNNIVSITRENNKYKLYKYSIDTDTESFLGEPEILDDYYLDENYSDFFVDNGKIYILNKKRTSYWSEENVLFSYDIENQFESKISYYGLPQNVFCFPELGLIGEFLDYGDKHGIVFNNDTKFLLESSGDIDRSFYCGKNLISGFWCDNSLYLFEFIESDGLKLKNKYITSIYDTYDVYIINNTLYVNCKFNDEYRVYMHPIDDIYNHQKERVITNTGYIYDLMLTPDEKYIVLLYSSSFKIIDNSTLKTLVFKSFYEDFDSFVVNNQYIIIDNSKYLIESLVEG